MDDGCKVITIANNETLAQVSKKNKVKSLNKMCVQCTRVGNFIIGASGSDKQMCASSGAHAALNIAAEKK